MYLRILTTLFLLSSFASKGQNMVPNGDFENKRGKRYTTRPWRFVNTVDVFEMDDPNKLASYMQDWEIPAPHSGDVMVGIRIYRNYREFLQIRLPEELESGKRYFFEMYVHPCASFKFYAKELGASVYHRRPYYTSEHYIYQNPPQIELKQEKGIRLYPSDTTEWIKVSGTFRSDGSEKYLTVGNFSKKKRKDRLKKRRWWVPTLQPISYYFIDDIALYRLDRGDRKEQKVEPMAFIDSSYVLPDSLPYTLEEENYIYTIESKKTLTLENIRFGFGSNELLHASFKDLELVLEYLNANKSAKLKITGHTDNVGSAEANMKLSLKRAKAVYDYFIDNQIDKSRLIFEGKGEKEPIDTNETPNGRLHNRRVEIELVE